MASGAWIRPCDECAGASDHDWEVARTAQWSLKGGGLRCVRGGELQLVCVAELVAELDASRNVFLNAAVTGNMMRPVVVVAARRYTPNCLERV